MANSQKVLSFKNMLKITVGQRFTVMEKFDGFVHFFEDEKKMKILSEI